MHVIDSLDDPRVANYRNLRDRTLRGESLFMAEGREVVIRLFESPYAVESVLVAQKHGEEFQALVGDRAPLYVAPEALLSRIVGFRFHLGVLAVGRRRALPALEELLPPPEADVCLRLVVLPEVTKPENLGLVVRSAAGFGLDAVLLGPRCCDPLSRRAMRVSMGAVVQAPINRSADLAADLEALHARWAVTRVAAVLDRRAQPLAEFRWPRRAAVLVGNETAGLRDGWLSQCDQRVTIPMQAGVDSLNLGVAAGIFLYTMACGEASGSE